jgi:hypothetical protein
MPYKLNLPSDLSKAGWKVKIREKERLEPPHVTIMHKAKTWRQDLRSRKFLDSDPPSRDIHPRVLSAIDDNWQELCNQWDKMYPKNKVKTNG